MSLITFNGKALPPSRAFALDTSGNIFRDKFGRLSAAQWCEVLVKSIDSPVIDDVEFPGFPSREIQEQIHGSYGEGAIRDAARIYTFLASKPFFRERAVPGSAFLDFGSGWGRIIRLFMRDFDLSRLVGFEPQRSICLVARSLNPYISFINGAYTPDKTLPADWFDIAVGWSVLSHLPEEAAANWLEEMVRVLKPGGYCAFSTWGKRFLDALLKESDNLAQGKEVHWYLERCIKAAGNIAEQRDRHSKGEFVFISDGLSKDFGLASFLHPIAVRRILQRRRIGLELLEFDDVSLAQDIVIFRRN